MNNQQETPAVMKTQRFDEYLLGTFQRLRVCLKIAALILRGLSQMVKEK